MHVEDKDLIASLSGQVDGELVAAVYARLGTPLSPARWLGPLGNYLVARPAARAAAGRATERTDLPLDAAVVLGVGDGSLHVWSADPMLSQVHDHLGSVPLDRLTAAETEPSKRWWPLVLRFVGDDEPLELQARGDVRTLVDAIGRPGPHATG